jgi:CBS domain containing-hemolysin-like protein
MIGIISGFVLLLLAVVALVLQRLYSAVPAHELKRLARRGDPLAKALYRSVAYGASTRLLLWLVVGTALPAGLLLTLPKLPTAASFGLLAALVLVVLVYIPSMRLTVRSAQFAAFTSPAVAWVLTHLAGPLGYLARTVNRYRELAPHSQLYEKEDLMRLLDLQKEQVDNRILHDELELVGHSLAFNDRQAADVLQPRKDIMLINADESLGPVILDQLHKSGQNSFLVYKDKKENIIGSLSLRDAVNAKENVRVFDLIRHDLTYVHEDFTLRQVMTAFRQTGQHVAVVINKFEEFLGVVTLDKLITELMGEPQIAVESYEDRSVVAAYKPKTREDVEAQPEQAEQSGSETEPQTNTQDTSSPEATEVVE